MQFLSKKCRGRAWLFSPSISRTLQMTGSRGGLIIRWPNTAASDLRHHRRMWRLGRVRCMGEVPCRISGSGSSRPASPPRRISQARLCARRGFNRWNSAERLMAPGRARRRRDPGRRARAGHRVALDDAMFWDRAGVVSSPGTRLIVMAENGAGRRIILIAAHPVILQDHSFCLRSGREGLPRSPNCANSAL
jgi:hypothetical protein